MSRKEVTIDDLFSMSDDSLIKYIEENLVGDELDTELEPELVRELLAGEGAAEFRSLLLSTLSSQIKDKVKVEKDEDQDLEIKYENYYQCDECSRKFASQDSLDSHPCAGSLQIKVKQEEYSEKKEKVEISNEDSESDQNVGKSLTDDSDYEDSQESSQESEFEEEDEEEEEDDSDSDFEIKNSSSTKKNSTKRRNNYQVDKRRLRSRWTDKPQKNPSIYTCISKISCDKAYSRKVKMHDHLLESHLEEVKEQNLIPIFNCLIPKCDRIFSTKGGVVQHIRRLHQGKKDSAFLQTISHTEEFNDYFNPSVPEPTVHECQLILPDTQVKCGQIFGERKRLNRHHRLAHGVKKNGGPIIRKNPQPLFCFSCEITFPNIEEREKHEEVHAQEKPFKCSKCFKRFGRKDHCQNHERNVHKENTAEVIYCPVKNCTGTFKVEKYLQRHVREVHSMSMKDLAIKQEEKDEQPEKEGSEKVDETEEEPVACPAPDCGKKFKGRFYIKTHLQQKHPDFLPISCPEENCPRKFALDWILLLHRQRVHNLGRSINKEYKCNWEDCSKVYKSASALRNHKKVHLGVYKVPCEVCGKFFSRPNLIQHMRFHTKEKPYKCPHTEVNEQGETVSCPYAASHPSSVQQHMSSVHGVKKFKCQLCPTAYAFEHMLQVHIRSKHTGERPFACDFEGCTMSYASRDGVRIHKKSHQNGGLKKQQKTPSTGQKLPPPPSLLPDKRRKRKKSKELSNIDEEDEWGSEISDEWSDDPDFDKAGFVIPGSDKTYKCTFKDCSETFHQGNQLRRHMQTHGDGGSSIELPAPTRRKRRRGTGEKDKEQEVSQVRIKVEEGQEAGQLNNPEVEVRVKVEPEEESPGQEERTLAQNVLDDLNRLSREQNISLEELVKLAKSLETDGYDESINNWVKVETSEIP